MEVPARVPPVWEGLASRGPPAAGSATVEQQLELSTVLRISEAISAEIVPERLYETLLRIGLEEAGADRGVLLVPNQGEMQVVVEGRTDGPTVHLDRHTRPMHAVSLSATIVNQVARTHERVLTAGALAPDSFTRDGHLADVHIPTVLCLPLVWQTALLGILYLEHASPVHAVVGRRLAAVTFAAWEAARALEQSRRKHVEALLIGEKRILQRLAAGDPLARILDDVCRLVEAHAPGVLASILLLDGDRLRHGAAPSLPAAYTSAVDGAAIGPVAGSCGTAAYRGEAVIVADIATDPLWANYRDLALPHGLRACWSTPVFSSTGKLIATFAMYYREPHQPSADHRALMSQITNLAGLAIERALTEQQLRRSETYLTDAERLSRTGSFVFDTAMMRYIYYSEEMFRIWGFDRSNGLPVYDAAVQRLHPEDRDAALEAFWTTLRAGRDKTSEFRIMLPDGTVKHVRAIAHPILDAGGELRQVVGTHVDVTERKRAEEERERLRQLEADLAHLNRLSMMGEFAASLAHEIKQPLAAAIANTEAAVRWLGRQSPNVARASKAAAAAVRDAMRAAEIVDGVRTLYGRGKPQREPVDINALIRDMSVLLQNRAERHRVAIRTALDPAPATITADRVQLQQVLMNLMLNGVEAMQATGGELMVTSGRTADDHVLVSVADAGIGLPVEGGDGLFEPFVTTKPHGTGLGLSISRRIVEAHGGRLWATANPNRGATFQFTIAVSAAS
jgi:PAS domain S-box-containing protein